MIFRTSNSSKAATRKNPPPIKLHFSKRKTSRRLYIASSTRRLLQSLKTKLRFGNPEAHHNSNSPPSPPIFLMRNSSKVWQNKIFSLRWIQKWGKQLLRMSKTLRLLRKGWRIYLLESITNRSINSGFRGRGRLRSLFWGLEVILRRGWILRGSRRWKEWFSQSIK